MAEVKAVSDLMIQDAQHIIAMANRGSLSVDSIYSRSANHPVGCTCPTCLVVATTIGPTELGEDGKMVFGWFGEDTIAAVVQDDERMAAWRLDMELTPEMSDPYSDLKDELEEVKAKLAEWEEIGTGILFFCYKGLDPWGEAIQQWLNQDLPASIVRVMGRDPYKDTKFLK